MDTIPGTRERQTSDNAYSAKDLLITNGLINVFESLAYMGVSTLDSLVHITEENTAEELADCLDIQLEDCIKLRDVVTEHCKKDVTTKHPLLRRPSYFDFRRKVSSMNEFR